MATIKLYWSRVLDTGLLGPVIALLASMALIHHLLTSELYSFGGGRAGYGPLSWPEFALSMLILTMAFLCATRIRRCILRRKAVDTSTRASAGCDNTRTAIGGWMILLYGLSFVFLGFLLSSILFLTIWLWYGGIRNPLKLAALSIPGTLAPLYLLVKLAYMPLPRGVGVFETITIQLYGWLGIF